MKFQHTHLYTINVFRLSLVHIAVALLFAVTCCIDIRCTQASEMYAIDNKVGCLVSCYKTNMRTSEIEEMALRFTKIITQWIIAHFCSNGSFWECSLQAFFRNIIRECSLFPVQSYLPITTCTSIDVTTHRYFNCLASHASQ